MRIAHMTAEHVPQVAALEKVCFSDPWSEKSVASELENPLSCWLVALDGGTVAGYVGSQTDSGADRGTEETGKPLPDLGGSRIQ